MRNHSAKPLIKWAGGKSQLLPTLNCFLPKEFTKTQNVTYIEPFVGGGAMLFFMLQEYSNISEAIINDINPSLITLYKTVRNTPRELIDALEELSANYFALRDYEQQKVFYLDIRNKYNSKALNSIECSAFFIFLNRTCFNGLYRENSKGAFNVPFGRYSNPTICNAELILADSEILQRVEMLEGDFSQTIEKANDKTFFYLDPPYRPLDTTSNFNSYVKTPFDDNEQIRLRDFFVELTQKGCKAMLSNSDGKGRNPQNDFLDNLYKDFYIERISAKRQINANGAKRGEISELLIRNYHDINLNYENRNLF
ncbi:MAG: DNA adenine methylase [Bacteroides sp.]|nr:DNA adenine methylase [Bacteroides sp.]MCM1379175.1 DNA adenine methylase [Bacteroides sp.]MCM1445176.1 DNA adenine methylase [Prevotella sp.]